MPWWEMHYPIDDKPNDPFWLYIYASHNQQPGKNFGSWAGDVFLRSACSMHFLARS